MATIDFHADDYGFSKNCSKEILELCKKGKLTSVSCIPNFSWLDESVKMFNAAKTEFPKPVKVSVHLNLVEGKCVAPKEEVPNLVDDEGYFCAGWGQLLLWNYNPFMRKKIKNQIKKEFAAQIKQLASTGIVDTNNLRLDSHRHPHMIPVVFEALCDAVEENNFNLQYVRNSQDPVLPYFKHLNLLKTFSLVNMLKCFILNSFSGKVMRCIKRRGLEQQFLSGVFFSGRMDLRVKEVLPSLLRRAEKKSCNLELLFHPGTTLPEEMTRENERADTKDFYLSDCRKIEYETLEKEAFYGK